MQNRGPSWLRPSGSVRRRPSPYALLPWAAARARARATLAIAPGGGDDAHFASRRDDEDDGGIGFGRFERARSPFREPADPDSTAASTRRRTTASSASIADVAGCSGRIGIELRAQTSDLFEIALGAERAKRRRGVLEVPFRGDGVAVARGEPAECQLAQAA